MPVCMYVCVCLCVLAGASVKVSNKPQIRFTGSSSVKSDAVTSVQTDTSADNDTSTAADTSMTTDVVVASRC